MADAPIHPPTAARVAEARAAGLAPRLGVGGMCVALLALALLQARALPSLWQRLGALSSAPLEAWTRGDASLALQLGQALALDAARALALLLAAMTLAVGFCLWLLQGPVVVWPRRPRRSFRRARVSLLPHVLFTLGLTLLLGLCLVDAVWLEPGDLTALWSRWWGRVALLVGGVLVLDAALARERFYRALWLTRREQREEWREAYGAPELRAARAEQRASRAQEPR